MAKKGEAKVTFTAEVSGFTEGISKINKSLGNLKSDLKLANTELKANGASVETLTSKKKALSGIVEQNAEKIELLQKKLASCKTHLGENSTEYQRLYKQLNNAKGEQARFQAELKGTERALDNMGDEAKNTAKDIGKLDNSMDDVEGGSSGLKGVLEGLKGSFDVGAMSAVGLGTALGNLASEAISACINAIGEFAQYLWELPEATEEFRMNMAKLSGATQQYGYDTDFINDKVKILYGYFSDEQVAVNAITNLEGMGLAQEDLAKTTDACIAVWTAYGDSIPIESLTESVNETSQVKKVTGSLADALNWAGISEDEFNKKLETCKTTQEAAKLITDTLNGAYGKSKETFDENTESIRQLNEEEYEQMDVQGQLAEKIEPLKLAWENLKTTLLTGLIPVIEQFVGWIQQCADKIQEFGNSPTWETLKTIGTVVIMPLVNHFKMLWEGIQMVWDVLQLAWTVIQPVWDLLMEGINAVLEPFAEAWTKIAGENNKAWDDMIEGAQVHAQNWANLIKASIDLLKQYFTEGWNSIKTEATNAWNNIKDTITNAWNSIKTTITEAVIGILTTITSKFNEIKTTITNAWEDIKNTIKTAWESIKSTVETAIASIQSDCSLRGVISALSTAWDSIKSTVKTAWNSIKSTITSSISSIGSSVSSGLNNIKTTASNAWNTVKTTATTAWNNIKSSVTTALSNIRRTLSSFKPSWSIPKPKLPKVTVGTSSKTIAGITIPYPTFSVSWNALGGIFKKPTIFNTPYGLQGVGEAGAEAILPLDSFYKHLDNKLDEVSGGSNIIINMNDFHIHDNLDINTLTEQIAFQIQRKTRF